MSIKNEILEILNTTKFYYKGIPMNAFFLPVFEKNKKSSVRNEFNKLYKEGYLDKKDSHFFINKNGKKLLEKNKKQLKSFDYKENNSPKNLLVLYDIPEDMKKERDWFRHHLIKFGYVMIQRSVWVGPSPLAEDFLNYVKSIGLKDSIKTFKLENGYGSKK